LLTQIIENDVSSGKKEPGWKTREMEEKFTEIAVDFVNSLYSKGFLRLQFDASDVYIEKILIRLSATNKSFGQLYEIVSSPSKFRPFVQAMQPFGFSENDIMRIFTGLFAHCKLEEFEFLKTIMLMITEKKQFGVTNKGKPKEIHGGETLGQLLSKYDELIPDNKISDNINNEIRTVLGHGKWWTKSLHFCFVGSNGSEKQYDIPQLFIEAIQLATFVRIFYEKGFERATQIKRGLR